MRLIMILRRTIIYLCLSHVTVYGADLFSFDNLRSYAKSLDWRAFGLNSSGNELWNGIINDCSKKMTFSCIQKNAYTYLDEAFVERDNITVFEGFVLKKNDLDYESVFKRSRDAADIAENLVEASDGKKQSKSSYENNDRPHARNEGEAEVKPEETEFEEHKTPLEEITSALRDKAIKFLATRKYELELPDFFFDGSTVKISPREIDEKGALIRVDFGQRGVESEARIFKKIKKFIQNKLLVSFFALILIIKLIKVKFFFVLPFLFGIGAAKKLFLKLLLFFVPAFAHVFKLCSSYYSSNAHRYYHHHQIAHHHHHVPVPVPVPTYYAPNHHHHPHEDHEGYDYPHPHIQLRKDMEELKEWGISSIDEPYDDRSEGPGIRPTFDHAPLSPVYHANSVPVSQHVQAPRPSRVPSYQDKYPGVAPPHAQSLAYNGYVDEHAKFGRKVSGQSPIPGTTIAQVSQVPAGPINIQLPASSSVNVVASNLPTSAVKTIPKAVYHVYSQQQKPNIPQQVMIQHVSEHVQQVHNQNIIPQSQVPVNNSPNVAASSAHRSDHGVVYDDAFYGPILQRLDDIFAQLRFVEESCRERLLCSMYKNPAQYSPHSNLVSNELSRDPQELNYGNAESQSSQRFYRYTNAARVGQDGGDCLRTYPCQINTE